MAKTQKASKSTAATRQVKDAKYRSFSLQKKITQVGSPLPSAYSIFKKSLRVLKSNWKLFGGILCWYGLINIIFVQGLNPSSGLGDVKTTVTDIIGGGWSHIITGAASFAYLMSMAGGAPDTASNSYQLVWTVVISLALIWTLRQVHAGQKVRIRDGFYLGMYPFIPFILVLMVIGLQCIPLIIGGTVFSTVMANGIAATWLEIAIWTILFFLLALLTVYMVCSSLFALYIVGLPDTTPMTALRSARQLVANRRWTVLRKMLFLPAILLIIGSIVMVPLILLIPAVAVWVFVVLSIAAMAVAHSYYYALYRSLL